MHISVFITRHNAKKLFFLIICSSIIDVHLKETINLAVITPWSHDWPDLSLQATAGVVVALEDIIASGLLLSYNINWKWVDSWCSNPHAIIELEKLYNEFNGDIHGVIGDGCSAVCESFALLGAAWNVPIVSFGCTMSTLSNKIMYPTFARVGGSGTMLIPIMRNAFNYFNWTRIAIISDTRLVNVIEANSYMADFSSNGKVVYRYTIEAVFDSGNAKVSYVKPFLRILNDIRNKARGMVVSDIRYVEFPL